MTILSEKIVQLRDALVAMRDSPHFVGKSLITDFKSQQKNALLVTIEKAIACIEKELCNSNHNGLPELERLKRANDIEKKLVALEDLSQIIASQDDIQKSGLSIPKIVFPSEIREEVNADLNELKKCFDSDCFRSAVVLCGRLLETALHRKYFEVAGNDLLEKSPGIGLGNLLAKMEEKSIKLDPGLSNQIHLINQVRIYSVHKKQLPFYPTKTQTNAIILYTLDVLKRLFAK